LTSMLVLRYETWSRSWQVAVKVVWPFVQVWSMS
jgi:hypothetical protein